MPWMAFEIFPSSTSTPGQTVARISSLLDERAMVSNELDECLERFFRKHDALTCLTTLERALGNVELYAAELIDFDGPINHVRASERKRNEQFIEGERLVRPAATDSSD